MLEWGNKVDAGAINFIDGYQNTLYPIMTSEGDNE